ncbi:hypothetical protein [Thalassorhabdomicrobium marinisediminis]|uniref:hypothetical protein n=1 Tax=Thalassorhabdomicrobium marinisediminis TaxID=2170577 RepID=UPI00248FA602|nr:hypothetical protein [Thalassorhabdomicrobium marinisediminis]
MDRLSFVLTLVANAVLVGSLLTLVLALGYYTWPPIVAAIVVGFILSWPAAFLVSRWIKRDDPEFDHTRIERTKGAPVNPNKPEV